MVYSALLLAIILCAIGGEVLAQDLLNQRLKVTGDWNGERLEVQRVEVRERKDDTRHGRVIGLIDEADARAVRVGPLLIEWSERTEFIDLTPAQLVPKQSIEAEGHLISPARLRAESIKTQTSPPRYIQLRGTVTEEERRLDGSMRITILGIPMEVSKRTYQRARALTRDPDDRRPEEQLTVMLFGRPLTIGGEFETQPLYRANFELEDDAEDDLVRFDQELQLEFFYPLMPNFSLFLEGQFFYEADVYTDGEERKIDRVAQRGESWLYMSNVLDSPVSLQLGAQNFREERAWWWDTTLDAIRLYYDLWDFHSEVAVAKKIGRVATVEDPTNTAFDDALRLLVNGAWRWEEDHRLDFFLVYQDDDLRGPDVIDQRLPQDEEDPSDVELVWLGGRASGELDSEEYGELDYWLDAAWVGGREVVLEFEEDNDDFSRIESRATQDVSGWALDAGISWTTPLPGEPTLTLGYARGSGDSDFDDDEDQSFRQTGLQNNRDRFNGVNRFRYYGDLLRPELSNLEIGSALLGFRFWSESSVELVYHWYRQVDAAPFVRESRINADPEGREESLGQEWDLIVGLEEWRHVDVELSGSLFRAGSAFGALEGELAYQVVLEVDYNF
jgi:alginate production protein